MTNESCCYIKARYEISAHFQTSSLQMSPAKQFSGWLRCKHYQTILTINSYYVSTSVQIGGYTNNFCRIDLPKMTARRKNGGLPSEDSNWRVSIWNATILGASGVAVSESYKCTIYSIDKESGESRYTKESTREYLDKLESLLTI
jgi:hypothetical protein